jgi:hypothetical protein
MGPRVQPTRDRLSKGPPPVLLPIVTAVPNEEFKFTDSQFDQLAKMGQVKFSEKHRITLETLAQFWIDDLRVRATARPKQFEDVLETMRTTLSQAREACRLNDTVGSIGRHLLHWAMEAPVQGAATFAVAVMALEHQIDVVLGTVGELLQYLPEDEGRTRPFGDERRIIFLADIYEEAGGKATVYWRDIESGMADTPFRRFAQQFYSLLPAVDKREPGGLVRALRVALAARREQRRAR